MLVFQHILNPQQESIVCLILQWIQVQFIKIVLFLYLYVALILLQYWMG
jgi:hypothetical protein